MKRGTRIAAAIVLFFSYILTSCHAQNGIRKDVIEINGYSMTVEIAETDSERMKGLMDRKSLDPESGMLFVFETDRKLSFWMKNTSVPLSIAFINSDGVIREIRDMTPFSLDPVYSANNVRFALEVNRGFFTEKGILPGDRIVLPEKYRKK